MSKKDEFQVRAGQTWRTTGSNKGVPCEVKIKITDMYVTNLIVGGLDVCYVIDYTFDGKTEQQYAFKDLHKELFDNGWELENA